MITYLKIMIFFLALFGSFSTIEHTLENLMKIYNNRDNVYPNGRGIVGQVIPFYWALFTAINWTVFYALNQIK